MPAPGQIGNLASAAFPFLVRSAASSALLCMAAACEFYSRESRSAQFRQTAAIRRRESRLHICTSQAGGGEQHKAAMVCTHACPAGQQCLTSTGEGVRANSPSMEAHQSQQAACKEPPGGTASPAHVLQI